uniref:Cysteine sulfinic acid decarboxylase n=1 Tax=Pygocentrus nattereri TaxID=42514 RepID=A0AAR2ISF8_PYGNA
AHAFGHCLIHNAPNPYYCPSLWWWVDGKGDSCNSFGLGPAGHHERNNKYNKITTKNKKQFTIFLAGLRLLYNTVYHWLMASSHSSQCSHIQINPVQITCRYTYEVAPVFVLMEDVVLRKLRSLVGWSEGDGIFCPGGSVSNMYAMNVARYWAFPQVKTQGLWTVPRLAVFTSQESHYSMKKSAAFLGIGTENVYHVKVDESGRMIPEDLEAKIVHAKSQGAVPFFVNATAGTTVQGAFDPLDRIADISERNGIWMHVDAAWGGSVVFSKKHKHLIAGMERANSCTWNPHKMLMAGLQCSVFLMRDTTNLLMHCHCANATYLFQQDKFYDMSLDTGDKSIQCGRKVDCLKLWLMWKAIGAQGLANRVDIELKKREGFQVVSEPQFVNVCFWFIPPSLRGKENSPDYQEKLAKVAPVIKERMVKKGSMMVGYQPLDGRVNFFRMVILSPQLNHSDLDFFLDEVERLGNDL